jgi:hypothetical protein
MSFVMDDVSSMECRDELPFRLGKLAEVHGSTYALDALCCENLPIAACPKLSSGKRHVRERQYVITYTSIR